MRNGGKHSSTHSLMYAPFQKQDHKDPIVLMIFTFTYYVDSINAPGLQLSVIYPVELIVGVIGLSQSIWRDYPAHIYVHACTYPEHMSTMYDPSYASRLDPFKNIQSPNGEGNLHDCRPPTGSVTGQFGDLASQVCTYIWLGDAYKLKMAGTKEEMKKRRPRLRPQGLLRVDLHTEFRDPGPGPDIKKHPAHDGEQSSLLFFLLFADGPKPVS